MMHMLETLMDYNYGEHRKLWQHIFTLDNHLFLQDVGYSLGSIQREVVHIIRADRLWFSRAIGISNPPLLPYETTDKSDIRSAWDMLEQDVKAYIQQADEATLQETIQYYNPQEIVITRQRWELLIHLVNHGSVHRAEMCAIFHMLGKTLDFEVSFRQYLEDKNLAASR